MCVCVGGGGGRGIGGKGQNKKIDLGPGIYNLKFAVNKFCWDIALPVSRPDKRSKLLIIEE